MEKLTVKDINVDRMRVLVRADFNVLRNREGEIIDDFKLTASLPTIKYLLKKEAKIILVTHLGRAFGRATEYDRVDVIAERLEKLLKVKVKKLDRTVGPSVIAEVKKMKPGEIILLENVRFHPAEFENEPHFAKQLASLADIYVDDSFGTSHRRHASTVGVAQHLPSVAGLLFKEEFDLFDNLLNEAEHPFVVVLGGISFAERIPVMSALLGEGQKKRSHVDTFLTGGALATTLLRAQGYEIGSSKFDPGVRTQAQEMMLKIEKAHERLYVPEDVVVVDELSPDAPSADLPVEDLTPDMKIADIGAKTLAKYEKIIAEAKTVLWVGPMGAYEMDRFGRGTEGIAKAMAKATGRTIVAGGDTITALRRSAASEDISHISTGGGAVIHLLAGETLPAYEALEDRTS